MTCPQWEERINDFADGSSEAAEALAVQRHLDSCPGCRQEAEALRSLLRAAACLPRRIEPDRDLWPGLAARMRRPLGSRLWPGIAAAVMILAAGAATSTLWRSAPAGAESPATVTAARYLSGDPGLREAEEEFMKATVKLMAALERRKADLPPGTLADIEESLRVVNLAIAETGAALARDPRNRHLERLLTGIYATRLDLLSRAVRVPGAA